MAAIQDRESKGERLEVRLTPATKSLLTQAAQLRHTTLSEFLISSAMRAAEDTLVSPRVFEINSDEGWQTLMALLDSDQETADPKLVQLLKPR